MQVDGKILEQRLITKDSVVVVSSLSRISNKLSTLRANEDQAALEQFLREVFQCKLEHEKSLRAFEGFPKYLEEFHSLECDIFQRTQQTFEEIEQLKERVAQEKLIREHRIKCEESAQKVNRYQSRSVLKRKLVEIDSNRKESEQRLCAVNNDLITRKTQFNSLITALLDLESQITQLQGAEEVSEDEEVVDEDEDLRNQRMGEQIASSNLVEEDETKVEEDGDNNNMQTE